MDIRSDQEKAEAKDINLDSEPSTPYPPNATDTSKTTPLIDSDDEIEATDKLLEEYYDAKIDHKHPEFPMIQETVKEELKYLLLSIYLFIKSKPPYSSVNYIFIAKVAGSEMRQQNYKDTSEQSTPQVNNDKPINPKSLLHKEDAS